MVSYTLRTIVTALMLFALSSLNAQGTIDFEINDKNWQKDKKAMRNFYGEKFKFSQADSLRGSLNEHRAFNVHYYELFLKIEPKDSSLQGVNHIHFTPQNPNMRKLQLDLFDNMRLDSIIWRGKSLEYERIGNHFWVKFPQSLEVQEEQELAVYYGGQPKVAVKPPWDGGFVWKKDPSGKDWAAVACEGIGASLWWPNKDHLSEVPDSMRLHYEVPKPLKAVGNGVLEHIEEKEETQVFSWKISYPIINYNVTVNIADYGHFSDTFETNKGLLPLDFYVLKKNKETAKAHFQQVKPMLACYEQHFGSYPFLRDTYKLVETPYWGMEHQSAIAYGNQYRNNGFDFDYIIIHESGHEYFGNSVSVQDHAEMWIHESFTTYMEAIYVECMQDSASAVEYLKTQKGQIQNQFPVLGPLDVNFNSWPDSDMYFKGTWFLHTLRMVVNDDEKWWPLLYDLHQGFKYRKTNTDLVVKFLNDNIKADLLPLFSQFLHYPEFARLALKTKSKQKIKLKWNAEAKGFEMPVIFYDDKGNKERVKVKANKWTTFKWKHDSKPILDRNFLFEMAE